MKPFKQVSCIIAENISKSFQQSFLERYFYKTENFKNISETLQDYYPKVYKETFQKEFLYHCLKCFSKVFGSFWTRF